MHGAALDLEDARAQGVEEVSIVRTKITVPVEFADRFEEHLFGAQIEVVGWARPTGESLPG